MQVGRRGYKNGVVHKRCTACKHRFTDDEFYKDSTRADGLDAKCKECRARQGRRHYQNSGLGRRLSRYGIELADYEAMLTAAAGCCMACGTEALLVIDHCHESGKVRGLLCNPCNLALGIARDDPARLRSLAQYLDRSAVAGNWS